MTQNTELKMKVAWTIELRTLTLSQVKLSLIIRRIDRYSYPS